MLKRAISILIGTLMLLSVASASSEEPLSLELKHDYKDEKVSLMADVLGSGTVTIAPEDMKLEDMSVSNLPTVIKQYKSNDKLDLTIAIPKNAPGGKYAVYVSSKTEVLPTMYFMHVSEEEVKNIKLDGVSLVTKLASLNGTQFATAVTSNASKLGIDVEDAGYMANKSSILSLLDDMPFDNVDEFVYMYRKAYAISELYSASQSTVKSILKEYQNELGIDYEADFENESRLTADEKAELLNLISSTDFALGTETNGDVDFEAMYKELKPLAKIKKTTSWIGIKEVITNSFKDMFGSMLSSNTDYKSVKDKDKVYEEMKKLSYTSFESINDNFDICVKKVLENEKQNVPSTGSSSTGSSSTGGGTISVPQAKPEEEKPPFSDVDSSHWASMAINQLYSKKVISGYADGTFKPQNQITRAEFTKLICTFINTTSVSEVQFEDVAQTQWYYEYVMKANAAGIVKGSGSSFMPNAYITREDAAVIIYRLMEHRGNAPKGKKYFADRSLVSDYAIDAVGALGEAQIVKGVGDNNFAPKQNITRAEAAQIIYNALLS